MGGVPFFTHLENVVATATHSLWLAVSFVDVTAFKWPLSGTTFFDLLDTCVARGLDVRVLFWHNPQFSFGGRRHRFDFSDENLDFLVKRGAAVKVRWDVSGDDWPAHCHHEKSFLVDCRVAFVGGICCTPAFVSTTEHGKHNYHDVFGELRCVVAMAVMMVMVLC